MDEVTPHDVALKAIRIFPLMGRLMEARMRDPLHSLSPVHFHVLNMVDVQPYTLSEMAEKQSISPASLSRSITVMEERGWLKRTRSEEDRRVVLISITEAGHAVLRDIEKRSHDFMAEVFESLSQEDLNKLMDGLNILMGSFAETLSHLPSDRET